MSYICNDDSISFYVTLLDLGAIPRASHREVGSKPNRPPLHPLSVSALILFELIPVYRSVYLWKRDGFPKSETSGVPSLPTYISSTNLLPAPIICELHYYRAPRIQMFRELFLSDDIIWVICTVFIRYTVLIILGIVLHAFSRDKEQISV